MPNSVRGLDDILIGSLPEFSLNIINGTPGCRKTMMVHQIAFANGASKRPAPYFAILDKPYNRRPV
jgi:KaiC/GvpD/RAD55 family RecA-like ATPase